LTQGDTPWNPSSFSDQVADKFYQQVINNEQKNSLNTKSDYSSDIQLELVEQDIPKLSYFNPSDTHDTNVKGKYANLVFHLDTVVMKNTNDINQSKRIHFIAKPYLLKLTMKTITLLCIPHT
jgi:hypothetical protein